jgi:hypothetical protein
MRISYGKMAFRCDLPIVHGNSGGPVLDLQGRAVGLNSFIELDAVHYRYFMPLDGADRLIRESRPMSFAEFRKAARVDGLLDRAKHIETVMKDKLHRMQADDDRIGDVRGRGLMLGIELVKDKKTKEPISKAVANRIFQECLKRGLLSMTYSNPIRIIPPLNLTPKVANEAADILEAVFTLVQKDKSFKQ